MWLDPDTGILWVAGEKAVYLYDTRQGTWIASVGVPQDAFFLQPVYTETGLRVWVSFGQSYGGWQGSSQPGIGIIDAGTRTYVKSIPHGLLSWGMDAWTEDVPYQ